LLSFLNNTNQPALYLFGHFSFGFYGIAFLIPDQIWTKHFHGDKCAAADFSFRGSSLGFLSMAYFLGKIGGDDAVKAALVLSACTGILYPWGVKFNLFGDDLKAKPLHAFPEFATLALAICGLLAL